MAYGKLCKKNANCVFQYWSQRVLKRGDLIASHFVRLKNRMFLHEGSNPAYD